MTRNLRRSTICPKNRTATISAGVILIYPPSQKATGVNPWMNARGVPSVALAKEGTLRRVPPYEVSGRCHGRKAVGLHFGAGALVQGLVAGRIENRLEIFQCSVIVEEI